MSETNIFVGDSYFIALAVASYKKLINHQCISYRDAKADYHSRKSAKEFMRGERIFYHNFKWSI